MKYTLCFLGFLVTTIFQIFVAKAFTLPIAIMYFISALMAASIFSALKEKGAGMKGVILFTLFLLSLFAIGALYA